MSIALVTAAFKTPLPTTPKFVLVALCDIANDQGECFPGVPLLMTRCSLSERAVQGALNEVEKAGYLRREFRSGRATLYTITPPASWPTPAANAGGKGQEPPQDVRPRSTNTPADSAGLPRTSCAPAPDAPPQDVRDTPAAGAPPPPQDVRDTPAAGAPITVIEPSVEPSLNQEQARASLPTAAGAVGLALKRGGIDPMSFDLNDPRLLALIAQGATPDEFEGIAREAKGKAKPFAWLLTVLPARRADAAAIALAPPPEAAPSPGIAAVEHTQAVLARQTLTPEQRDASRAAQQAFNARRRAGVA